MSGAENIQLVRDLIGAFNADDVAAMGRFADPNLVYIIRGNAPVSGTYHGWEEMGAALRKIRDLCNGDLTGTPEVVLADENSVMMFMATTGTRPDGRRYNGHQAYLYRIRDGRIYEGQTIPVDQQAFAEFLA